jgi:hypothetical protein
VLPVVLWVVVVCCSGLLPWGCRSSAPQGPGDITPPHTTAMPAGGIFRVWSPEIRLVADEAAAIFYAWDGASKQRYTAPIRVPVSQTGPLTLTFWAQDTAGNREPPRRAHYVLAPAVPHLEYLGIDRTVLGLDETAAVRWRSTAVGATYALAVTQSGWGPGRLLAHGTVTSEGEQHTPITGKALRPGGNRLWLRVQDAAGAEASTALELTVQATPATTRAWPAGGVFGRPQKVTLFTERPATIHFTTDGSLPTLDSPRYTTPLSIERDTVLHYFSVDAYGNREAPHQERYEIHPQAPTITLQTRSGDVVGGEAPVVFTWRSDMAGRYEVVLVHGHEPRQVVVQQGTVQRHQAVHSTIAPDFVTAGAWRAQVRVQPDAGKAGVVSFWLRAHYLETFAETRYLDTQGTTAAWDTAQRHVRLTRGPRLLATYQTRAQSRRVAGHGPYAYLANSQGGLHIVDVSNPHEPWPAGVFDPHGVAVALAKHGQFVYVAASDSGLAVFDVTDPAVPRLVAMVPVSGVTTDIAIAAPYAYVGTQQGVLYILDLTLPLQPRRLGEVEVEGRIVDIAVGVGVVYLACLDRGVVIVEVHTPQQPRLLQRWPTAAAATAVAVHGPQAYVVAGALEVLDVQRLEAPLLQKRRPLPGAYGVTLWPPYALLASGTDGVQVVAMDGHGEVHQSAVTRYAVRLAVTDRHAFVADLRGGLQILDLAHPTQPQLLASLDGLGTIVDVVVDGAFAYLPDNRHGSGLVVVDIRAPAAPHVVARYHHESTIEAAVWEGMALLGDAAGVLQVIDVQQPAQPRLLGALALPGVPHRLAVLPPYVLVASGTAGLHVVDLTQPSLPQLRTTVPIAGQALDIALTGHMAYIAAMDGGIQEVDCRTPLQPVLGVQYRHPDGAGDQIIRLLADQQHLYAIDSQRGLQLLHRPAPGQLRLQGSFVAPEGALWALTMRWPYLFVTTVLNSLYVLDVTTPAEPRLLSTAPYGGADIDDAGRTLYVALRGRRQEPGGLRLIDAFTAVPHDMVPHLQERGVVTLSSADPETHLVNRAYTFNTPGVVQSLALSPPDVPIYAAVLQVQDFWGASGRISYEISNDGGTHWHPVEPGERYHFPQPGTDLRWRATLVSTDLLTTPVLETIRIDYMTSEQTSQ